MVQYCFGGILINKALGMNRLVYLMLSGTAWQPSSVARQSVVREDEELLTDSDRCTPHMCCCCGLYNEHMYWYY